MAKSRIVSNMMKPKGLAVKIAVGKPGGMPGEGLEDMPRAGMMDNMPGMGKGEVGEAGESNDPESLISDVMDDLEKLQGALGDRPDLQDKAAQLAQQAMDLESELKGGGAGDQGAMGAQKPDFGSAQAKPGPGITGGAS